MTCLALCLMLAAGGEPAASPPLTQYEATSTALPDTAKAQSSDLPMAGDGFDRMTVPVHLGLAGPYRFLVDTGSDRTSVSHDLARRLGLEQRAGAILHSATGSSEVRMAHLPDLRLSRKSVRHIRAPMLEAADMGADGILGIDSLRSERVVFDFRAGTLSLQSGESPVSIDPDAIVVRARRMDGRLVVTDAEINGVPVRVVLDTGSAISVGNSALKTRLERRGGIEAIGPIDLVSVTGAALRGQLAIADSLEIGGARLDRLGVVFADAHTFRELKLDRKPALLLGMNALRGFDQVTIDFARRTLVLVLPAAGKPRRA
jgi:predicted aspartyl protease